MTDTRFPVVVAWPNGDGTHREVHDPIHQKMIVKTLRAHSQAELDSLIRVGWAIKPEAK